MMTQNDTKDAEKAKNDYNDVSERLLQEFDRFRNENATLIHVLEIEISRYLVGFATYLCFDSHFMFYG